MGFFDKLLSPFKKKSDLKRFEALSSDLNRQNTEDSPSVPLHDIGKEPTYTYPETALEPPQKVALEKESVQLGFAAGYTGRSIRDIEASLIRIETQMVTKDWLLVKLSDFETRLEKLSQRVESLFTGSPARGDAGDKLTYKMSELISAVRDAKELSYEDLAKRLHIGIPALRGLLSNTMRRTDSIERFSIGNKGWVRYLSDSSASNRILSPTSTNPRSEFEKAIRQLGYNMQYKGGSYSEIDYILEKEGKLTGVQIKDSSNPASVEKGLAQLTVARTNKSLSELWIVLPDKGIPSNLLETLKVMGMKVYWLDNQQLREF